MKLAILSQYFYPELISTGQLLTELAEDLANIPGTEIQVWASHPNYYERGRIQPVIQYAGIRIRRVWSTQFTRASVVGRLLNQATFLAALALKVRTIATADCILAVTCPPLLPALAALASRLGNARVFILIHDVYPDIAIATGHMKRNGAAAAILDRIMRTVYASANRIIVLGRDMAKVIESKLERDQRWKVEIIENWCDGDLVRAIPKSQSRIAAMHGLTQDFVVQYSGNMGMFHDMETLVSAAERLQGESVQFLFVGGGAKRALLEARVRERCLGNVRFVEYQNKKDLTHSLACSDVSAVTLCDGIEGLCVPCKLYGILASGRPALGLVPEPSEVAHTIREGNCGVVVSPGDVDGAVRAIRALRDSPQLRETMGRNARAWFEKRYERRIIIGKYARLLTG